MTAHLFPVMKQSWSCLLFSTLSRSNMFKLDSTQVSPDKVDIKAKIGMIIPTFWRTILNVLDFQLSRMMKMIRTVQVLFSIFA